MNKKYNIRYNAIPEQNLRFANQLTVHQWNEIINILRVQTNLSSEYIEKLHLWLIGTNPHATLPEPSEPEYGGNISEYDGIIDYIFNYLNLNNKLIAANNAALNTHKEDFEEHKEDFEEHKEDFEDFKTVYNTHVSAFETHKEEFERHKEEFETHKAKYNSLVTRVESTESAITGLDERLDTAENTIDKLPDTYVPKDWSSYETHDQYVDENAQFIIKIDGKEYTTTMKYLKDIFLEHTESHYRGNFTSYESLISTTFEPQLVAGDYAFVSEDSEDPNFVTKVLVMYIWDDARRIWTSSGTGQYASYASLTKLKQDLSSGATTVGSAMTAQQYVDAEGNIKNISETFEENTVSLTVSTDPYEDTEYNMRGIEINGDKFNIPSADITLRDFVSPSTTKELKEIGINGTFWKVSSDINLDDIPANGIIDLDELPTAKWKGTTVPNEGTIEKIYFNTNLDVTEVLSILEKFPGYFTSVDASGIVIKMYVVALTDDIYIIIAHTDHQVLGNSEVVKDTRILVFQGDTGFILFSSTQLHPTNEKPFIGWNPSVPTSYEIIGELKQIEPDSGTLVGVSNNELNMLFSTTPFIYEEAPVLKENVIYRIPNVVEAGELIGGSPIKENTLLTLSDVVLNPRPIEETINIFSQLPFMSVPAGIEGVSMYPVLVTSLGGNPLPIVNIFKYNNVYQLQCAEVVLFSSELVETSLADGYILEANEGWNASVWSVLLNMLTGVGVSTLYSYPVSLYGSTWCNDLLSPFIYTTPYIYSDTETRYMLYQYKNNKLIPCVHPSTIFVDELPTAKWKGTTVPNEGTIEKIYFNTNLDKQRIKDLLSYLSSAYDNDGNYYILETLRTGEVYMDVWINYNKDDDWICIYSDSGAEYVLYDSRYGWYYDNLSVNLDATCSYHAGSYTGVYNALLSELVSTTPFELIDEPLADVEYSVKTKKIEWRGTPLSTTDLGPGNIYFNYNLSVSETVALIEKLSKDLSADLNKHVSINLYILEIHQPEYVELAINYSSGTVSIYDAAADTVYFTTNDGWLYDLLPATSIRLKGYLDPRFYHSLISSTPFVKQHIIIYDNYKYINKTWAKQPTSATQELLTIKPDIHLKYQDVSLHPFYREYLSQLQQDQQEDSRIALREYVCVIKTRISNTLAKEIENRGAYLYLYKRTSRRYKKGRKGWSHPRQGTYGVSTTSFVGAFKNHTGPLTFSTERVVLTEIPVSVQYINNVPYIYYEFLLTDELATKIIYKYTLDDTENPLDITLERIQSYVNTDKWYIYMDARRNGFAVTGTKSNYVNLRYSLVIPGLGESLHTDILRLGCNGTEDSYVHVAPSIS